MGKDLGTYHVHIKFTNGEGFIYQWHTSARYTHGTAETSPLHATRIAPVWESEDELVRGIVFFFTDGNGGCDCNRLQSIGRASQTEEKDHPCGHTLEMESLTIERPDGSFIITNENETEGQ